jgi:hypothetical protein
VTTGYSGTSLARKLGVKDGQRTWRYQMPSSVTDEIAEEGLQPKILKNPSAGLEMVHIFVTRSSDLESLLLKVRPLLAPSGMIWVSWPKRAAKVPTEVNEDTVRAKAFPLDLVDIKVCSVDETWSGLKLVIRVSKRVHA